MWTDGWKRSEAGLPLELLLTFDKSRFFNSLQLTALSFSAIEDTSMAAAETPSFTIASQDMRSVAPAGFTNPGGVVRVSGVHPAGGGLRGSLESGVRRPAPPCLDDACMMGVETRTRGIGKAL